MSLQHGASSWANLCPKNTGKVPQPGPPTPMPFPTVPCCPVPNGSFTGSFQKGFYQMKEWNFRNAYDSEPSQTIIQEGGQN